MRNWTVGMKIAVGFAVMLTLMLFVGGIGFINIRGMGGSTRDVIGKNNLAKQLTHAEIAHLNWAKQVTELLTDESVTELKVQTNPHECSFGKWYYSAECDHARTLVDGLGPLLDKMEAPHTALHTSAVEIGESFTQADAGLPEELAQRECDHLKWMGSCQTLFTDNLDSLNVEMDPRECAFGKFLYGEEGRKAAASDPELQALIEKIKEPHEHLHESAAHINEAWKKQHPGLVETLQARLDDHRRWAASVSQAILSGHREVGVQTDPHQCAFGKFLASPEAEAYAADFPALREALGACTDPHKALHTSAIAIEKALKAGDRAKATRIYTEETLAALDAVADHFLAVIAAERENVVAGDEARKIFAEVTTPAMHETQGVLTEMREQATARLDGMNQANLIFAQKTKPNLEQIQSLLGDSTKIVGAVVDATNTEMLDSAKATQLNVTIVIIASIIIGVTLAFIIARGIVKALVNVIASLATGAQQVNSASNQVSESSQSMAEGASEQAASLEEISASLEEVTSMTRQNADNATKANAMSSEASDAADKGRSSMERMSEAIERIKQSSDDTAKIIKTIDEIAFQTNLLALNAAVEAARAGEAGKGFAVVAEEVRNLAQRSAEAARNTSELIAGAQQNAENGVTVCSDVSEILTQIGDKVSNVTQLVAEVNAASNEQAQGIDQVNGAMAQLDQVTQSNAANSEEAASASEELSAQANELNDMVAILDAMAGGSGGQGNGNGHTRVGSNGKKAGRPAPVIPQLAQRAEHRAPATETVGAGAKAVSGEEVIPLDDDDVLDDF
ncbi:MAG: methyl-accepting chemotaxis protein [bacterium]|nr:methyl-accepting chemotaxis protein [bacterium]